MRVYVGCIFLIALAVFGVMRAGPAISGISEEFIFDPGILRPTDSVVKIRLGDPAPDFTLPSIDGSSVTLSQFRGKKNVVLSFVPAAWTPVCSDQWPGYNLARPLFERHNAMLLGISVDNLPTLYAWTRKMGGLWFPVLSDFWPHGQVSDRYGFLRTGGIAERALVFIDGGGIVRAVHVSDINVRPDLKICAEELKKLDQP